MEYLAKEIVEEFEKSYPIPTSVSEWENEAEEILLYLAAKVFRTLWLKWIITFRRYGIGFLRI